MVLSLRLANAPPALVQLHAEHVERQRRAALPLLLMRSAVPPPPPAPCPKPEPYGPPLPPLTRATLAVTAVRERDGRPVNSTVMANDILCAVCAYYDIRRAVLISSLRTANIVHKRHVAIYLARTLTEMSFPQIGRKLGDRDHTTALHAYRKVAALLADRRGNISIEISDLLKALGAPAK